MLTPQIQKSIAETINKKVDIPVVPEKGEYYLFLFAVKKIDKLLDEHLPEQWSTFFDAAIGFIWTKQETTDKRIELFKLMDDNINIPFIGREWKREILAVAAHEIVNGLKKGEKI